MREGLPAPEPPRGRSDGPFLAALLVLGGTYVLLIAALLAADVARTSPTAFSKALGSPEIQSSIKLSLISCSITAILSLWVAVPLGYLMSRHTFRGKVLLDVL